MSHFGWFLCVFILVSNFPHVLHKNWGKPQPFPWLRGGFGSLPVCPSSVAQEGTETSSPKEFNSLAKKRWILVPSVRWFWLKGKPWIQGGEGKVVVATCLVNQIFWGVGVVGWFLLGCVERGAFSFLIVTIQVEFWKESENYLLTLMLSHLVSTYNLS